MTTPDNTQSQPDTSLTSTSPVSPTPSEFEPSPTPSEPSPEPSLATIYAEIEKLTAEVRKAELINRLVELQKPSVPPKITVHTEIERLTAKVKKAKLARRLNELKKPQEPAKSVWERPGLLTLIVGFLSTVPPTVTAVHGFFATQLATEVRKVELEKEHERLTEAREVAAEEKKIELEQEDERLKNAAIKQALDASLPDAYRFRALRYLSSKSYKSWATDELGHANDHLGEVISDIDKQIQELEYELEYLKAAAAGADEISRVETEIAQLRKLKSTQLHSDQALNTRPQSSSGAKAELFEG